MQFGTMDTYVGNSPASIRTLVEAQEVGNTVLRITADGKVYVRSRKTGELYCISEDPEVGADVVAALSAVLPPRL